MTPHYPRIRHYGVDPYDSDSTERLLVREVVRFAFYMPHDHPEIAAGVAHAFDSYMRAVGEGPDTINFAFIDGDDGYPLNAERWNRIHRLLRPDRPFRFAEDYHELRIKEMAKSGHETWIHLTGGYGSLNGYELRYSSRVPWRDRDPSSNEVSLLAATLPTEYLEEHGPSAVRELALQMASGLRFASGHTSLAFELRHPAGTSRIHDEMLRYPGLSLEDSIPQWMGTRVDGVHWLNFLGQPVLGELGGAATLRERLKSPETTVQELEGARAMVTLGEWPEAGDLTQGRTLPAYRELARVLEPWLDKSYTHPTYRLGGFTQDEALRWARRFLD